MRRGTTPTILMKLPDDIQCEYISDAVFSIAQSGNEIVKKDFSAFYIDSDNKVLAVKLTQEDTLSLSTCYSAHLQLKIRIHDNVLVSDVTTVSVGKALNEDILK